MEELFAEAYRLQLMRGLEGLLAGCGYCRVAGIDEAGRGALAGPVVAAAVIPDPNRLIPGIDDSKQLSPEVREGLAELVRRTALASAVVAIDAAEIDAVNILEATRRAMRRALASLDPAPDLALIDAVPLRGLAVPSIPVIRGDAVCYAIACASILAKVDRDRRMVELDRLYPQYGFRAHKGYGAPEHLAALATYGPSPIHRLTFRSVLPRHAAAGR